MIWEEKWFGLQLGRFFEKHIWGRFFVHFFWGKFRGKFRGKFSPKNVGEKIEFSAEKVLKNRFFNKFRGK
jgi:hypothetical protein